LYALIDKESANVRYEIQAIQIRDGQIRVLDSSPVHTDSDDDLRMKVRTLYRLGSLPRSTGPLPDAVRAISGPGNEVFRWGRLDENLLQMPQQFRMELLIDNLNGSYEIEHSVVLPILTLEAAERHTMSYCLETPAVLHRANRVRLVLFDGTEVWTWHLGPGLSGTNR
jgi:hypothetical protein